MWNWKLLRAGAFRLDGGGMFGVVPKTIWSRLTEPDEHNRIGLQTNCLLLDNGDKKVLVETGYGDKWTEKERGFWDLEHRTVIDALREAGCEPERIDLVVVTHLHFDHAAALTRLDADGNPVPTFPNAQVVAQQQEWEDALANKSTMSRTYLRSHLDPIADRMRPADGEQEVMAGLTVWPMPGHTWGQQAVRFDDGDGLVCFPGDVMPTVHHVGPAYSMGYDVLPYLNMRSKLELLHRAHDEGWRIILDHGGPRRPVPVGAAGDRRRRLNRQGAVRRCRNPTAGKRSPARTPSSPSSAEACPPATRRRWDVSSSRVVTPRRGCSSSSPASCRAGTWPSRSVAASGGC
jgi:glyoxylase-like metal-dependent hydrolase (beta-lactamase superfamily II)